ncbi:MAG: hypothetical protein ABIP96_00750 [Patescibacteria group bacterium]
MYEPLRHADAETKSDDQLTKEAADCLAGDKARQFAVTLLRIAFEPGHPWLTFDMQRLAYPAIERFGDLDERKDVRQTVVTELTGMLKNMARKRAAENQAELVDAALEAEDRTVTHFVQAFPHEVTALYGRLPKLWKLFMENFPWGMDAKSLVDVITTLLEALVQDRGDLLQIMTHLRMRMLIDEHDWQTLIPVEKRMEVALAKNRQEIEASGTPFTAQQEMEIVTLRVIAENIPLEKLKPIFSMAEMFLGFVPPTPPGLPKFVMDNLIPLPVGTQTPDETPQASTEDTAPSDTTATATTDPAPASPNETPPQTEPADTTTSATSDDTSAEISIEADELIDVPSDRPPPADASTADEAKVEESSVPKVDDHLDNLFDMENKATAPESDRLADQKSHNSDASGKPKPQESRRETRRGSGTSSATPKK